MGQTTRPSIKLLTATFLPEIAQTKTRGSDFVPNIRVDPRISNSQLYLVPLPCANGGRRSPRTETDSGKHVHVGINEGFR